MLRSSARRGIPLLGALVLVAGLPAAALAQETQDSTRVPAALRSARANFMAAFSGRDAAKAAALFADSAVVDDQGQVVSGRAGIAQGWIPGVLQTIAAIRFGASSYVLGDRDVVERGTYYVTPAGGGGEQAGSHEVRWRRMPDGTWKVMRLIIHG